MVGMGRGGKPTSIPLGPDPRGNDESFNAARALNRTIYMLACYNTQTYY